MRKIMLPIVFFFLIFMAGAQNQQEIYVSSDLDNKLHFGVGFGIGFFNPGDVNDYIEDETNDLLITYGFSTLIVNYSLRATLCYSVTERIDINFVGEFSLAPKIILVDGGDNLSYYFNKFSPGIVPKFYFPVGNSGRNSIFLAPGLLYNFMSFEDFSANSLGGKLEGGFSFKVGKTKMQPFAAFEYAKAVDDENHYKFEMNYTRFQIGMDFIF
jgi:hypothetical protein